MSDLGWIRTFSGFRFYPLNPRLDDIQIEDIAHALGNQTRFAGHTRTFYSVAQHSVLVSQLCRPGDELWGLLHDAAECYLQDVVRPLKELPEFDAYRIAERRLQRCIVERFGLSHQQPDSVTAADDLMLAIEYRDLIPHPPDDPYIASPPSDSTLVISETWTPQTAEREFLGRFEQLLVA